MYPALSAANTRPLALMKSADQPPITASRFVALGTGRGLSIPGSTGSPSLHDHPRRTIVTGVRFQIKARRITNSPGSRQLSAIRNLAADPFDHLAAVLFESDFLVHRAALIPIALVKERVQKSQKYPVIETRSRQTASTANEINVVRRIIPCVKTRNVGA
jgi:hypothetical protein